MPHPVVISRTLTLFERGGWLFLVDTHDPWARVLEAFFQARAQRNLSPSTLRHDRHVLARFHQFVIDQRVKNPASLEASHLAAWEVFLRQQVSRRPGPGKGQPLTAWYRFVLTSTVLNLVKFLIQRDHLLIDPRALFLRARASQPRRPTIPTIEEMRILLDSIERETPRGIRDHALLELLYSSGLRAAEARQLDEDDLDLPAGQLGVRHGKGGRDRLVPVGSRALAALENYLGETRRAWWRPHSGNALFLSLNGKRIYLEAIRRLCRRRCRAAGLPLFGPHALRHACATHLLQGGADIRHVQAILGHQSILTTVRYTHLAPLDLVEAHQDTHPRGGR